MSRLTKFVARSASVAALLALTLGASASARADCVTPFGTIYSMPASDGSSRTFVGNVAPFGPVTGTLQIQVNPLNGTFTGTFTIVAAGGTAYGTIQGRFLSANTYVEMLTIAGGTGIYTGITGYAYPVFGSLDLTTGAGRDVILGGRICLPASSN